MAEATPRELRDQLLRQLHTWRKDLLALDRRQRMLYFRHTKSASFEVARPGALPIWNMVHSGDVVISTDAHERLEAREIQVSGKTGDELRTGLRRLDQGAHRTFADRAVWPLYLGFGMLEWIDPQDTQRVNSPLLLLPIDLNRAGIDSPYTMTRRAQDEPMLNATLALKLERDFGIRIPEIDLDEATPESVVSLVSTAISGYPDWQVSPRVVLTNFSFHKEAMYQDLKENEGAILSSPLVQLVGLGPSAPSDQFQFAPLPDDQLDEIISPESLLSVLDADGSQRKCIIAARDGRSFVMDGPPGTGKSQTIANIIAELIGTGKSVLFVSEKAAALEVVQRRLKEVNLAPFMLELHSSSLTRKQFAQLLGNSLSQRVRANERFTRSDRAELERVRIDLNEYAQAINEVREPFGRSIHWAIGRMVTLHETESFKLPRNEKWRDLTPETFATLRDYGRSLARSWLPVEQGDSFLWRDLLAHVDAREAASIARECADANEAASRWIAVIEGIDEELRLSLPLSYGAAVTREELLRLLEKRPEEAEPSLLTAYDINAIKSRAQHTRQLTEQLLSGQATLRQRVGETWTTLPRSVAPVVLPIGSPVWVARPQTTTSEILAALEATARITDLLQYLEMTSSTLATKFGMTGRELTAQRAADLANLARLAQSPARPLESWLNPNLSAALGESATVLETLILRTLEAEGRIRAQLTPAALQLELEVLHQRISANSGLRRFTSVARADRRALKQVAVRGRVDKALLEALPEAVLWQHAHRALTTAESEHAQRLGSYYRHTETDFERVRVALTAAKEALRLAGSDLNVGALAAQLAEGATADPELPLAAEQVDRHLAELETLVRKALGEDAYERIVALHFEAAIAEVRTLGEVLTPLAKQAQTVSTIAGRDCTAEEAQEILALAARVDDLRTTLDAESPATEKALGRVYRGVETDWARVEAVLSWADSVRNVVGRQLDQDDADRFWRPLADSQTAGRAREKWDAACELLVSKFLPSRRQELLDELRGDLGLAVELLEDMAKAARTEIPEWVAYAKLREDVKSIGIESLVNELARKRAARSAVEVAVERAVLEVWAEAQLADDGRLRRLRASDRDALVLTFRDLDRRLVADTQARVIAACNLRRPTSTGSQGAQIIRREAEKKTRHKPIREVLSVAGDVAQELKPCFMMSPLTVSQFLPANMHFDVVIFDEASQVLPADAINCIYRGEQLIVAGDQKQLPPTNFFSTGTPDSDIDEADEDEPDVFDSLLDLCKAAGSMPSLPLTWHYRSQHEDLIAFSNYQFYKGELNTFPSARQTGDGLGIEAFLVDGVYRRGSSRDNPVEAAKVVDRIIFHAEENPQLSLGVVTFSNAQEDAILVEMERRARLSPVLLDLLNSHDRLDGFFVKNLESVQGDERDIIIFSVGYGPTEEGKIYASFGPINRDGGWRRLNVAITRARRRVELIYSFEPGRLPSTSNPGVRALTKYMEFARRGVDALVTEQTDSLGDAESPFEEAVIAEIRSLGFEPVPQVGTAGYRIDIGVRHPSEPGRYLLGVECDGAAYHSSKVARDRDRLRQEVLERLGWRIHRIWGPAWWRDRSGQIDRLRVALEEALGGADLTAELKASLPRPDVDVIEVELDEAPTWGVPYQVAVWSESLPCEPGSPEALPYLRTPVQRILARETPLHELTLIERLKTSIGFRRAGSQIRSNIDRVLSSLPGIEKDPRGFIRLSGRELESPRHPTNDPQTRRRPEAVPPEELRLALILGVTDARIADDASLTRTIADFFEWNVTGELSRMVRRELDHAVRTGDLVARDGKYRLADS